jgi:hypothetical protein
MKTFIYKEIRHPNRTRNNREVTVYRVKNNIPEYIGEFKYSTGSTRGGIHEVFNFLMNNNLIPKKHYKDSENAWRGAGYFYGQVTEKYNIIEI